MMTIAANKSEQEIMLKCLSEADLVGVKKALESGASATEVDERGMTPLEHFVEVVTGFIPIQTEAIEAILNVLKEAGADLDEKNSTGWTLLMKAATKIERGRRVTQALINSGAAIHEVNDDGKSALSLAVEFGGPSTVSALLLAGADPNQASKFGITPLHMACKMGSIPLTKILLEMGADPRLESNDGFTPLDLSERMGNRDIQDLLGLALVTGKGVTRRLKREPESGGPSAEPSAGPM